MDADRSELKQISAQLLAGMLANPHIYPMYSDEKATFSSKPNSIA